MKDLLHIDIEDYCARHTSTPDTLLKTLERETHLTTIAPQMLPGPLQGRLLMILSKLLAPAKVLEIGTFTGYSTLCLAQGLPERGRMVTLEIDPEREVIIRKYLQLAGLESRVDLHIRDGLQWLREVRESYDLIYVDAAKRDYPMYYRLAIERLASGGVLLMDNMLWGGKVISEKSDKDAQILDALNNEIRDDPRTECVLLPVRDGISLIRKK